MSTLERVPPHAGWGGTGAGSSGGGGGGNNGGSAGEGGDATTTSGASTASVGSSALRPLQLRPLVTGGSHESIAEPELLALIIEMRLNASKATAGGTSSNNDATTGNNSSKRDTATSGSASPNEFPTMDLCHRRIQKLPHEMVDVLKDDIVR